MSLDVSTHIAPELPDASLGPLILHRFASERQAAVAAWLRTAADAIWSSCRSELDAPWTWPRQLVRAEALLRAAALEAGGDAGGAIEPAAIVRHAARDLGCALVADGGPAAVMHVIERLAGLRTFHSQREERARAGV